MDNSHSCIGVVKLLVQTCFLLLFQVQWDGTLPSSFISSSSSTCSSPDQLGTGSLSAPDSRNSCPGDRCRCCQFCLSTCPSLFEPCTISGMSFSPFLLLIQFLESSEGCTYTICLVQLRAESSVAFLS